MPRGTDGPETWVASQLLPWLDRKDRDTGELAGWLAGDLPPVGHEDEPYVWLLRALPLGARRTGYEQELARSAATLIDSSERLQLSEAVLYGLLRLSAGLRGRDALADPLYRMFRAGRVAKRRYTIHRLRDVLRNALIVNQKDDRLEPEWRKMLEGKPNRQLGGTPREGFEGVLFMPPSETERGKPALDAIAFGLTKMAEHLTPDKGERVPDFRYLLGRVSERYPGRRRELDFVHMSNRCQWPEWTDVALPNLCDDLGDNRFLLWWAIFEVVSRIVVLKVKVTLCGGRVLEVVAPQHRTRRIEWAASSIERIRQRNYRGLTGRRSAIGSWPPKLRA